MPEPLYPDKIVRIEHVYQTIRTVINIIAIILLIIVLWNQSRILNANRETVLNIQKISQSNQNIDQHIIKHLDCVANLFTQVDVNHQIVVPSDLTVCEGDK